MLVLVFFFFKQKTAYEMRISDWSSDVCSSDLMDETRGHGVSAFGRRRWFRDSIVPPVGKKCQGGVRGWPAPSDGAAGLAPGERSAAATPPPARGGGNRW